MPKLSTEYRVKNYPDTEKFRKRGPENCTHGIVRHCTGIEPELIWICTDWQDAYFRQHRLMAISNRPGMRFEIVELITRRTNLTEPIHVKAKRKLPVLKKPPTPETGYVLKISSSANMGQFIQSVPQGFQTAVATFDINKAKRFKHTPCAMRLKLNLEKGSGIKTTVETVFRVW